MSDDILITTKDRFPVENPEAVSTRLFFAQERALSLVWHICDAAIWKPSPDGKEVLTMALHGSYMHTAIKCDTVLQVKLKLREGETMCARCVEEFELAKQIIMKRDLLKFR